MRTLIVLTALAVTVLPKSAQAQEYPWCTIQYDGDGGEISTCGYVSWQQCMDTVAGGVGGYCRPNPYVLARPQTGPNATKKKQR
jgi:hypothetical protein